MHNGNRGAAVASISSALGANAFMFIDGRSYYVVLKIEGFM